MVPPNLDYSHLRILHNNSVYSIPIYECIPLQYGYNIIPMIELPFLECLYITLHCEFFLGEFAGMSIKCFPKLIMLSIQYNDGVSNIIIDNFLPQLKYLITKNKKYDGLKNIMMYPSCCIKYNLINIYTVLLSIYGKKENDELSKKLIYKLELPLK
jgi:hypothetical protein